MSVAGWIVDEVLWLIIAGSAIAIVAFLSRVARSGSFLWRNREDLRESLSEADEVNRLKDLE